MDRIKAKGRRESGKFVPFPISVLTHTNYINLSLAAHKVLTVLLTQLRFGKDGGAINNGDLCATWSIAKKFMGSEETLAHGIKELIYYGFITKTRQGEALRNDKPNLYAVTWWAIDGCNGKLDVKPTNVPTNDWKQDKPKYKRRNGDNKNGTTGSVGE